MLGCQDFCGYYEWTFHYLRRHFGKSGVEKYWAEAIAADAQQHYVESARYRGLRGLYESWLKTGVDEDCDWTVTLDEDKNLLRLDMRQCPSKGFLLDNDLNADEDYCDHCLGWIGPALDQIGAEVAAHEHNHCGQCWWEIRVKDRGQPTVQVATDIRQDSRWGQGYLHRYAHHDKLPILAQSEHTDSCDVLTEWFCNSKFVAVLGPMPSDSDTWSANDASVAVIVSGQRYAAGDCPLERVRGVLLEHDPECLAAVAKRFGATENQPLLMHCYLPGEPMLNFAAHGLPRAVPILPLLIRSGVYTHSASRHHPRPYVFAVLLAAALQKRIILRGIDFNCAPTVSDGRTSQADYESPRTQHGSIDLEHLWMAWQHVQGQIDLPTGLRNLFHNALRAGKVAPGAKDSFPFDSQK
jgi:hypothetical protein